MKAQIEKAVFAMLFTCMMLLKSNFSFSQSKDLPVYTDSADIYLSEDQLIKKLGIPADTFFIKVYHGVSLYEIHNTLYRLLNNSSNDTVIVKQFSYREGKYNKAYWLVMRNKKWRVFDNVIWDDRVQF
ncbi:MAG: hypothetical protein V4543_06850 [Bacteroidota bacterium]